MSFLFRFCCLVSAGYPSAKMENTSRLSGRSSISATFCILLGCGAIPSHTPPSPRESVSSQIFSCAMEYFIHRYHPFTVPARCVQASHPQTLPPSHTAPVSQPSCQFRNRRMWQRHAPSYRSSHMLYRMCSPHSERLHTRWGKLF